MRFPPVPGHFPGQPLVPGAAVLAAVDAALRAETGHRIVAVQRCRFLEPVVPGEEIGIVVRREGESVRFDVVGDGRTRARGVARCVPTAAGGVEGGA